jgi:CRISPR/Cas system-associated exonuclease Cas4 (RecB family)
LSLFQQRLASADIPFDTRPLQDLEVIGVLETRGLVFEEVVIIDMQEGVLPSERKIDPLVPIPAYAILGLPDNESFQEMEAYYFNRLIHSSKKVHLVWIQDAENRRSRFVERLIWRKEKESGKIGCVDVKGFSFPIQFDSRQRPDFIVRKDSAVMKALEKMVFSPTAIDAYLFCRLRFYYEKILGLRAPGKVAEGLEADEQGRLIHSILERAFEPFVGIQLSEKHEKDLVQSVRSAISYYLPDERIPGEQFLFKRIALHKLTEYVQSLLETSSGLTVLELEKNHSAVLDFGGRKFPFQGRIDRVDSLAGKIVLVDYKTGGSAFAQARLEWPVAFPDMESVRKQVSSFQLPIYMAILLRERQAIDPDQLDAKLVFLREKKGNRMPEMALSEPLYRKKNPIPLRMGDFLEKFYFVALEKLLSEMMDPDVGFSPYREQECGYCPFRNVCGQE